jgi:integrase/recombinase XerD
MSVYRRGKTYWVRFQFAGEEYRRSARTASRPEALAYERDLREQLGRIARGGRPRHTYREAMERFLIEHCASLKPGARTRYISSAKALHPQFKDLYLDQIGRGQLADFISARRGEGVTTATIRRDLACLSSMLGRACEWNWIDVNPVRAFSKRGLKEAAPRIRFLSRDEFAQLHAAAAAHLRPMLRIAVGTGLRLEEMLSLRWVQVSLARQEITLTETKTGTPRVVPIPGTLLGTFSELPRHIREPWVFWHGDGRRFTTIKTAFLAACRRAGIKDFRWHDLRHTFASWAVQDGMDLYRLSRLLGHKTMQMTARYAHLQTADLHEAVGTNVGTHSGDSQ